MSGQAADTVEVMHEPRTYEPHGEHSYFQDLVLAKRTRNPDAEARLQAHDKEWQAPAERDLRVARRGREFEVRVTPNWTPGEGGYFAPPQWLIERYADVPRAERILARLAPKLPLPRGPQTLNLPVLSASVTEQPTRLNGVVPDTDIADSESKNPVIVIPGQEDVPLAMLEQSPAGASLDWVIFTALQAAYEEKLEQQLLGGTGTGQILGLLNVSGRNTITYTSASPTGSALYPLAGQALAAIGNKRKIPPEAWLMNTSRFAWIATSEDKQERPLLLSDYEGDFPTASMISRPVYLDDAMPTIEGGQVPIIACCPSDFLVLESTPVIDVMFQPLSGSMGARIQMRTYVCGITNRYPTGISVISGTGMVPVTGF